MPYIVLAEGEREIDRRELSGPIVIGRSPECDISVRDILLSRRHCAIEPFGSYWVIADLGSKNGTLHKGHRIARHVLAEGEVLRMGKIQLCFRAGAFIPAPPDQPRAPGARPVDPKEALAGTVAGFRFEDDETKLDPAVVQNFPRPKPKPVAPRSLAGDQVSAMLADIVSSSWDNVLADSASRKRAIAGQLPKPILKEISPPPGGAEESSTSTAQRRDEEEKAIERATAKDQPVAPSRHRGEYLDFTLKTIAWLWAALILVGWLTHLPW